MSRSPLSRRKHRPSSSKEVGGIVRTKQLFEQVKAIHGDSIAYWFTKQDDDGFYFTIDQIVQNLFPGEPPEYTAVLKHVVSEVAEDLLGDDRYIHIVRDRWRKNLDRNIGGRGSDKHRATSRDAGNTVVSRYGKSFYARIAGHVAWVEEEIDMAQRLAGELRTRRNLRDNRAIACLLNNVFHGDRHVRTARSVSALFSDLDAGRNRGIK